MAIDAEDDLSMVLVDSERGSISNNLAKGCYDAIRDAIRARDPSIDMEEALYIAANSFGAIIGAIAQDRETLDALTAVCLDIVKKAGVLAFQGDVDLPKPTDRRH